MPYACTHHAQHVREKCGTQRTKLYNRTQTPDASVDSRNGTLSVDSHI